MLRLALVHTGGTIASRPDASGAVKPQATPQELTESLPQLERFELTVHQPFQLPSPHVTPQHMHRLRDLLEELAPRHDGIVLTHGTDTLEETAFYLHLTYRGETGVALTGSMRHALEPSWDGPGNLWSAAQVAVHPASRGRGPLVVFGGDIFDARTVTKTHSTALDSFGGYPGPIGRIDAGAMGRGELHYFARPEARRPFAPPHAEPKVEILYAYAGWRGEGLNEATARADGVVIAALGTGNLHPDTVPLIAASPVPVVIATRTHAGPVLPVYGYPGGGASLIEAGAVPASFMNAHKARLLLIVLLALGYDHKAIHDTFVRYPDWGND
ncbi:L-asparaginase [Deinobacterium chartae]|uniref:L-asparaginase n=1 Tax=Deinobacterium chartae TaxID=521158 RepID=A0A841HYQ4_9DEIO|nr:asparaginase [Deinobacterium chartae]MBB6098023.1 L-asparaginase [Deinobacterium chartae]